MAGRPKRRARRARLARRNTTDWGGYYKVDISGGHFGNYSSFVYWTHVEFLLIDAVMEEATDIRLRTHKGPKPRPPKQYRSPGFLDVKAGPNREWFKSDEAGENGILIQKGRLRGAGRKPQTAYFLFQKGCDLDNPYSRLGVFPTIEEAMWAGDEYLAEFDCAGW